MGKKINTDYFDDFDLQPVDAEVVDEVDFSYRGKPYTLVLNASNAAQFDKDMKRYIDAANKAAARDAREAAKKKPSPSRRRTRSTKDSAPARPTRRTTTAADKPTRAPRRAKAPEDTTTATRATTPKATGSRRKASTRNTSAPAGRERTNAIRLWARANGHTVSARGRIADAIVQAYDAAN